MKFESSQRSHIREARLRKLKRAFCFYVPKTLTQNSIQPGKHFIYNCVRYAFQPLAVPSRHINGSRLVAANDAHCFRTRPFQ
ncbi:Uncharacterised protein [Serratia quinivorans]|nr:Uncharacterised protein [Serratia quinivorans]